MARRSTVGLKTAVSEFYFEQLDSLDQTKGKRCPGEQRCSAPREDERNGEVVNTDSGPLYKELVLARSGRTEDEVCGKCPRNGTRPGRHSPHLNNALALAAHLDELRQAGASFPYPGAFPNPYWWTCLTASAEGRRRADEARNQRTEAKRKEEAKAAEEARNRQINSGGGRR